MTRFARAKGSKASNEKTPEDGTPWEVMKEQLIKAKKENEDSKKRQEAEKQRIDNYENFLKEQRVQKRPATWCDFPDDDQHKPSKPTSKKKKQEKLKTTETPSKKESRHEQGTGKVVKNLEKNRSPSDLLIDNDSKKEKQIKNKEKNGDAIYDSVKINSDSTVVPKKKKKKKLQKKSEDGETSSGSPAKEPKEFSKKKKKKNSVSTTIDSSSYDGQPQPQGDNVRNKNMSEPKNAEVSESTKKNINKLNKQKAKKKKKLVDGMPVRRKEINDRSFPIIINGKEVELVRFDGFPVMRKDAERLAELKNNMIKKGIPKSEVQRTMKLERRRAEKALARVKRDVCYNCRKGGHNLSDCPELKTKIPGADAAEGVCFKCGSTEHRQFECKVQRDKEFRFATCFICKEQGHIARQCPDNPKGLYPNGGACKLCGDVTHLRKDCPTVNNKKEETSVKLQTLESTEHIEDIAIQNKSLTYNDSAKKPKKIKF